MIIDLLILNILILYCDTTKWIFDSGYLYHRFLRIHFKYCIIKIKEKHNFVVCSVELLIN